MKNANIVDFVTYLQEHKPERDPKKSNELVDAIETLITRLREHNPLKYPQEINSGDE